jgi:hypothetical protein
MEVYIRLSSDADAVTCCECGKMTEVEDLYEHFLQAHNMRVKLVSSE